MSDISVGVHATVIRITVDGLSVYLPRAQASEFLGMFMQVMAETIPDTYSRKVPDTPALRLVGAFHCDPDPSCGQDAS
jgi:hypothetical protein